MERVTARHVLEKLNTLPEEKLDLPIYAWGCQNCVHPVINIDLDDRVRPNTSVIMFETDENVSAITFSTNSSE